MVYPMASHTTSIFRANPYCKKLMKQSQWNMVADRDMWSSDNVQDGLHPMPFTPSYDLDGFSIFDDPLSYQSNMFETFLEDNVNNAEPVPMDMDNGKLLGFGAPIHKT